MNAKEQTIYKLLNFRTMKTQIYSLINGAMNIVRKENDEKYKTAKKATSHIGYAGTNKEIRNRIADNVYIENENNLKLNICGEFLNLNIHKSLSGKSWYWSCRISEEQYKKFGGTNTMGNFRYYSLTFNQDCTISVIKMTKKSEASLWKLSLYHYLDESFVTIL